MGTKREVITGEKDSKGRAIRVSGKTAASRSNAPAPAPSHDAADPGDADDVWVTDLLSDDPARIEAARESLLRHESAVMRAVYAGSPLAGDHLDELADDPDPVVRSGVAQRWDHPLPPQLLDDPSPIVAIAVTARLDTDEDTRARLLARRDVAALADIVFV